MSKLGSKTKAILQDVGIIVGGLAGVSAGLTVVVVLLVLCASIPWIALFAAMSETADELLFTTTSPDGTYSLQLYRVNPGATEPFYIRADEVGQGKARTVYNVRGQQDAEVTWLSDTVAQINGVPVDIASGACFKANARCYFNVKVLVKAADVQWLEATVCMGGEPRLTRSRNGVELADPVDGWGMSLRLNVLQELHWDDDFATKKAGLLVTVKTAGGEQITLPYRYEWQAAEYGLYQFTLTGSAAEGYVLTPEDMDDSRLTKEVVNFSPAD